MRHLKKSGKNAGETMVEVVASIFIFLILMGIMQGAISYSTASLEKNKEIRANTASVLSQLTQTAVSDQKEQKISFYAVGSDGRIGNKVFDVQTKLGKKKVVYTDTKGQQQETTFYLYDSVESTAGAGGGTGTGNETGTGTESGTGTGVISGTGGDTP